jgi:hypothetical protein
MFITFVGSIIVITFQLYLYQQKVKNVVKVVKNSPAYETISTIANVDFTALQQCISNYNMAYTNTASGYTLMNYVGPLLSENTESSKILMRLVVAKDCFISGTVFEDAIVDLYRKTATEYVKEHSKSRPSKAEPVQMDGEMGEEVASATKFMSDRQIATTSAHTYLKETDIALFEDIVETETFPVQLEQAITTELELLDIDTSSELYKEISTDILPQIGKLGEEFSNIRDDSKIGSKLRIKKLEAYFEKYQDINTIAEALLEDKPEQLQQFKLKFSKINEFAQNTVVVAGKVKSGIQFLSELTTELLSWYLENVTFIDIITKICFIIRKQMDLAESKFKSSMTLIYGKVKSTYADYEQLLEEYKALMKDTKDLPKQIAYQWTITVGALDLLLLGVPLPAIGNGAELPAIGYGGKRYKKYKSRRMSLSNKRRKTRKNKL